MIGKASKKAATTLVAHRAIFPGLGPPLPAKICMRTPPCHLYTLWRRPSSYRQMQLQILSGWELPAVSAPATSWYLPGLGQMELPWTTLPGQVASLTTTGGERGVWGVWRGRERRHGMITSAGVKRHWLLSVNCSCNLTVICDIL